MIKVCEFCGKEFDAPRKDRKYCCLECSSKARIKKIECKCAYCGKTLYKTEKEIARSKSGNVFCDRSCAASYNNTHFRTGEKNPNWKGGCHNRHTHLKVAKETYIQECAICGCDDKDVLEVHHIDFNHGNNDEDNLIVLCSNHHAKVHRGGLEITEEIKNKRKLIK